MAHSFKKKKRAMIETMIQKFILLSNDLICIR